MVSFNILHLSDLHYCEEKLNDIRIVRDALLVDLNDLKQSLDLCIFSGDLVRAGSADHDFERALKDIIYPILEVANVPKERLYLCPGNHDINTTIVEDQIFVENGLREQFKTPDDLNLFIDRISSEDDEKVSRNLIAFDRCNNFYDFMTQHFSETHQFNSPLFMTSFLDIRDISIGITNFNTAWRATGRPNNHDYGHLLIGERTIDQAASKIAHCNFKIAVLHHPTPWLDEFDSRSIEPRLYSAYDLLCFGHVHKLEPEIRITSQGTSAISVAGCLYQSRNYFNGYTIIKVNVSERLLDFKLRSFFNDPARRFGPAENVIGGGSFQLKLDTPLEGTSPSAFAQSISKIRPVLRRRANTHLNLINMNEGIKHDIIDQFVPPPIQHAPSRGLTAVPHFRETELLSPRDILTTDANYILLGKSESGKTSLAYHLAVLASDGTLDKPRIVFYLDFHAYSAGKRSLIRLIRHSYDEIIDNYSIDELVQSHSILIVCDNIKELDDRKSKSICQSIDEFDDARAILLMNDDTILYSEGRRLKDYFTNSEVAYLHPMPRKSIRALTRNWCEETGQDEYLLFRSVMEQLQRAGLPRTGYIITLILWSLHQKKEFERLNEAILLENLVDYILEKYDFRKSLRRHFDYHSRVAVLQGLARHLRNNNDYVKKNEALDFVIDFLDDRGWEFDASGVLDGFVGCGILSVEKGVVSFKYRRFQEYFLAGELKEDADFLNEIASTDQFLDYTRELDLFTARFRKEKSFLSCLHQHVTRLEPEDISKINLSIFSSYAETEPIREIGSQRFKNMQRNRLTPEEMDDLADAAERRIATNESSAGQAEVRERGFVPVSQSPSAHRKFSYALDLFGRAIRNSENLSKDEKTAYYKAYSGHWSKLIIHGSSLVEAAYEEAVNDANLNEKVDVEDFRGIVEFISKVAIPVIVTDIIADENASEKLVRVYKEVISDEDCTAVQKIISLMILVDLHPGRHIATVREYVKENKENRFLVRLILEKVYAIYSARPLDDDTRKKVEGIIADMAVTLGEPRGAKSAILANIQKDRYSEPDEKK